MTIPQRFDEQGRLEADHGWAERLGVHKPTSGGCGASNDSPIALCYLGSLDQGLTYSLHALLLCNDLAGLLRTLWQGVRIDTEMLALDLAREVGPRGNYLAQRHTVNHCRDQLWESRYFGPNLPLSTDGRPDEDLAARIDTDLRKLLNSHRPVPLDENIQERLRDICARFRHQSGCAD